MSKKQNTIGRKRVFLIIANVVVLIFAQVRYAAVRFDEHVGPKRLREHRIRLLDLARSAIRAKRHSMKLISMTSGDACAPRNDERATRVAKRLGCATKPLYDTLVRCLAGRMASN